MITDINSVSQEMSGSSNKPFNSRIHLSIQLIFKENMRGSKYALDQKVPYPRGAYIYWGQGPRESMNKQINVLLVVMLTSVRKDITR